MMPMRWTAPWTPKTSAPHQPAHGGPSSTVLTVVIVVIVILVVAVLARWYTSS
jgi:hypothetical protein